MNFHSICYRREARINEPEINDPINAELIGGFDEFARLTRRRVKSQQRENTRRDIDVCFAPVCLYLTIHLYGFEMREIIFHSLPETAKQHFPMNSDPIHPQYMYARCSLLRKPLFRVFTYVLSEKPIYSRRTVSQHQPSSRRNPVELLNSRTVSHLHERTRS